MRKILLLLDGTLANKFLEKLMQDYHKNNNYIIIYYNEEIKATDKLYNFKFHKFDPTSLNKLKTILEPDIFQVMIVMKEKSDLISSFTNIREINKNVNVTLLDNWNLNIKDTNLTSLSSSDLMLNELISHLPDIPITAKNIGLGEGEIMEILVPFSSSLVYRHIDSIEQKDWKIVCIYRDKQIILINKNLMIKPNDILLLVGKPSVLKIVYKMIKGGLGIFPAPFGTNSYLFINMKKIQKENLDHLISTASYISKKFKTKLIIRIFNANDLKLLEKIKEYEKEGIEIYVNYTNEYYNNTINNDIKKFNIGLIIISNNLFNDKDFKFILYNLKLPILKLSNKNFKNIKNSVVILNDNKNLEKISSNILDISTQLGLNLKLYDYLKDDYDNKKLLIEHFNNFTHIFKNNIQIEQKNINPIRILKKEKTFLYCLPFSKTMLDNKVNSFLSTDNEKLYYKLDEFHQILIPIKI